MSKNLVIVESPAKAKTIEGFLGKDFIVKSSFGHIRDLKKKGLGIDVDNQFLPEYEVSADKKSIVSELKKLSKKAEMVWLATDEDREGEAISWHLSEVLGLTKKKTKRIVFHEITKDAILKAVENPRDIDINVVDAQQARRILDRLVGFELSPILWKKVKPSLSAGRVQSVTVRLIVEKERDILKFNSISSYRVVGQFTVNGKKFQADLASRFSNFNAAKQFLESCKNADYTINKVEKKPAQKSPAPPFTTSTLQQEASRKLGFSVSRTMTVAQKLYEAGKITYMRTDSFNLSKTAINAAKSEIIKSYGSEYSNPKQYVTKSKGAQEAHEAIRPTDMMVHKAGKDSSEERLYDLIWKRTLASQMMNAQLERTTTTIGISTNSEKFVAKGEVIVFEGFLKVYLEGNDDENNENEEAKGRLPAMQEGDNLAIKNITATERFTHHPARYTEASLVKKLEELGIGRPSTYAPTISTVQKRGYVEKEEKEGKERKYKSISLVNNQLTEKENTEITGAEKNKLSPTDIGMVVNDFLVNHFERILSYDFTASVEKEFDEIATGSLQWNKMIDKFYGEFHDKVTDTLENSERASGERELGFHPETNERIIARIGRFGPMVQMGDADEEKEIKPKFASLISGMSIATISLEEALDLFKLPRKMGLFEEKEMTVAVGRFGPYVRHDSKFVSIPKDTDPLEVTAEQVKNLIIAKREKDAAALLKVFSEDETCRIIEGRWGPYIKFGKANVKIPKGTLVEEITYTDCQKWLEEMPKKGGRFAKKTTTKKAAAKKTVAKKKAPTKKKTVAKKK